MTDLRKTAQNLIDSYEAMSADCVAEEYLLAVSQVARAYLSEHPSDDENPVTWAWLGEPNASENKHLTLEGIHDGSVNEITIYVGHTTYPKERKQFCAVINHSPYMHAVILQTRGHVRLLCAALGIELKEKTND